VTIEERRQSLVELRRVYHDACPVCGKSNPNGLCIGFAVGQDGIVRAEVYCGEDKQGYKGHLHGGVIASLLDGAMTNCLFSYGIAAVTGELAMRFLLPVAIGEPFVVQAWLNDSRSPLYHVKSEIRQSGHIAARGSARFMQRSTVRGAGSQE